MKRSAGPPQRQPDEGSGVRDEEVGLPPSTPHEAAARQHDPRQPPSRRGTRRHVPAGQAAHDDTDHPGVPHPVLIDSEVIALAGRAGRRDGEAA